MTGIGDTTRDHITLGTEHPAETGLPKRDTEKRLLRYSRRTLTAGCSILVGTYLATFAAKTAVGDDAIFEHPTAQIFAVIGFISLHTLGASLILIAGLERITRPTRTLTRHTATTVADLAAAVETLRAVTGDLVYGVQDTNKKIDTLAGRLDDVNARLDSLDIAMARVPTYAQGVIDGLTSRTGTGGGKEP